MTRIDFYLLKSTDAKARYLIACKLAEKAWRAGMKITLFTASPEEDRLLDDLLWQFRPASFIPHATISAPTLAGLGCVISHQGLNEGFMDMLINLSPNVPPGFEKFERLAELIDENEAIKKEGRVHYRFYKDQGYAIETHQMPVVG